MMENFTLQSNHINFADALEDDRIDRKLSTVDNTQNYEIRALNHKSVILRNQSMNFLEEKDDKSNLSFQEKVDKIDDPEVILELEKELKWGFDNVSPLIYLEKDQRKMMLENITFYNFNGKQVLYDMDDTEDLNCYILFEGEYLIYNKKDHLVDIVRGRLNFFGYGGPIFSKRTHSITVESDSIIGVISKENFLKILSPFSKFSKFISRNILNKDKMFSRLDDFKNFVLNSISQDNIDIKTLLTLYKKINSCLHTKANNENEIDFDAWSYALLRLPENITSNYVYILSNKPPRILTIDSNISSTLLPKVKILLRNRECYSYNQGKTMIIVREMETDVLDFVSNMCIHIVESAKLRRKLNSPLIVSFLYQNKNSDINTLYNGLSNLIPLSFPLSDLAKIGKIYPKNLPEQILNTLMHYEDYSINIKKGIINENDPTENFIQNLWTNSRELLEINGSVDECDDLVVDIMQGSKRTLINCCSPHIYINKDKIINWAEKEIAEGRLKLQTPAYQNCYAKDQNNNDLLMAYSYYYYETFEKEREEKKKMEEEHGIVYITNTFSTGVGVILINPNKFDMKNMDLEIGFNKPASKNHLIIHIGYTFGAQSKEIIKPILLLFGSKTRSLNIMGKAGGLVGKRTDILISNKIFYDKNNDVSILNIGNLDKKSLIEMLNKKVIKANPKEQIEENNEIHIGPMLTVSGTILQNNDLLNFYKNVMGCVGLEMEGYFYAKEIESATKHLILNKGGFVTRCFYYTSDLPLDPKQNLAAEHGIVNWEEGVKTMNAIQRYILKQLLCCEDLNDK